MPKISSYPYDLAIQDGDAWIGSDAFGGNTKQYTANAVATYLNTNGKVSIGAQMVYKFTELLVEEHGTFTLPGNGGSGTGFSNISSIKIATREKSGEIVTDWLRYLVGSQILISAQEEMRFFGHYTIVSYTEDPDNINFYDLELNYVGGNGSILADAYYDIVNFSTSKNADKEYIHTQSTPSAIWTINHNLNKFPSVTTVNGNNIEAKGMIQYTDTNNLTITFSGGFSGKAYLN